MGDPRGQPIALCAGWLLLIVLITLATLEGEHEPFLRASGIILFFFVFSVTLTNNVYTIDQSIVYLEDHYVLTFAAAVQATLNALHVPSSGSIEPSAVGLRSRSDERRRRLHKSVHHAVRQAGKHAYAEPLSAQVSAGRLDKLHRRQTDVDWMLLRQLYGAFEYRCLYNK